MHYFTIQNIAQHSKYLGQFLNMHNLIMKRRNPGNGKFKSAWYHEKWHGTIRKIAWYHEKIAWYHTVLHGTMHSNAYHSGPITSECMSPASPFIISPYFMHHESIFSILITWSYCISSIKGFSALSFHHITLYISIFSIIIT